MIGDARQRFKLIRLWSGMTQSIWVAVLLVTIAFFFLFFALPIFEWYYAQWILAIKPLLYADSENIAPADIQSTANYIKGTLPYVYVGVVGILLALLAVIISSIIAGRNQNKHDSTRILFETILSEYHQSLHKKAEFYYPPGTIITPAQHAKYRTSTNTAEKEAAIAVMAIMDYYESLAASIIYGHLSETLTRKTVRSLLCRFVYDMQDIIAANRQESNSDMVWENLIAVYFEWADRSSKDEWAEGIEAKLGRVPKSQKT